MKDKIITYIFICYIFVFLLLHFLLPDNKISKEERRTLSDFPTFELSNEYIEEFDGYMLEHFPFRRTFRSIKANYNYKLLNMLDNNGIYIKDNYIYKSNYPTNKKSINNFIDKINKLEGLLSNDNKVYIMLIPDKNYYLNDKYFLKIDYDYIYNNMNKLKGEFIDIRDILTIDDYYQTDTHWKQENLSKVVVEMDKYMDFGYKKVKYKVNKYDKFYGVYYGESAINSEPENLKYLTSDTIKNSRVKYLENKKIDKVYNIDKLKGIDSYDVYLDGASAFIEIYNSNSNTGKELIIFRDSFGSSITPLLIEYYDKIIIIDNRYINSDNYLKLVDFKNQDVLFLYSTLLINDSYTLKG